MIFLFTNAFVFALNLVLALDSISKGEAGMAAFSAFCSGVSFAVTIYAFLSYLKEPS